MGIIEQLIVVYKTCRIPTEFWEYYWGFFVIGILLLSLTGKAMSIRRNASLFIIIEYAILVYCCTVLFRLPCKMDAHLIPFRSYSCIFQGDGEFLHDILLNILVFFPFGFLFGLYLKNYEWHRLLLFASLFSISIEMAQYIFQKGVAETDDVIHNTLGCVLGYLCFKVARKSTHLIMKKKTIGN